MATKREEILETLRAAALGEQAHDGQPSGIGTGFNPYRAMRRLIEAASAIIADLDERTAAIESIPAVATELRPYGDKPATCEDCGSRDVDDRGNCNACLARRCEEVNYPAQPPAPPQPCGLCGGCGEVSDMGAAGGARCPRCKGSGEARMPAKGGT